MRYIVRMIPRSGIPLGGIGTGYFEIRPDGRFYEWQIFNNDPWGRGRGREELMDQDDFFFAVRVKTEGENPLVRILRLGVNDLGGDLYTMPWVKNIEEIEYIGEYPLVSLTFKDSSLPVEVSLTAYSPFIPGDTKNSSLPVAIFSFRIRNPNTTSIEVSLLGALKNPIGHGIKGAVKVNQVIRSEEATIIDMRAENVPEYHITYRGSMSLAVIGDPNSITYYGLMRKSINDLRNMWVDLRADGELKSIEGGRTSEVVYGVLCKKTTLKPNEEIHITFILTWFFPNHRDADGNYLGHAYENWFNSSREVYEHVIRNLDYLSSYTKKFHDTMYNTTIDKWIIDSITAQLTTLITNSFYTKDGIFVMWEGGPGCCGFNTLDVLYYGTIPIGLMFPELDRAQIELSAKFQLRPGMPQFERYVLAFPENVEEFKKIVKKDPSILSDPEKRSKVLLEIVERTGKDPTGRIPHFFPKTISRVDAYHMVDLMPKFALLVYRHYLWSGDIEFLKRLWENVKMAIDTVLRTMDEEGRGVPYHYIPSGFEHHDTILYQLGVRRDPERIHEKMLEYLVFRGYTNEGISFQTYDGWGFLGYSSYIGFIWLAALRAVKELGRIVGDEEYVKKIEEVEMKARELEELLWNGEYFDLWYDPLNGLRDRACMADQLNGQWYANLCQLGYLTSKERIERALRSIFKYNLVEDEGLINAVYPSGERPSYRGNITYPNGTGIEWRIGSQPDTPWTGTEYAVASLMIQEGLVKEGIEVLRAVYERYSKYGMFWNHIECGGHYYRAMDVWAVLMALEGFNFSAAGSIHFNPKVTPKNFRGAFVAKRSWGTYTQVIKNGTQESSVKLEFGSLEIREICIPLLTKDAKPTIRVLLNRKSIEPEKSLSAEIVKDRVRLRFEKPIILSEGDELKIVLSRSTVSGA